MPRRVLISVVLLLAFAPAAQAKPSARALLNTCERGLDDADRAAVFEGQMRKASGAPRMQMRFTLQARTPETGKWSKLSAPGFGSWVGPAAGTSRYVYTKRVENLLAPASYRVLLRFRWLDSDGDVVQRAKAYSPRLPPAGPAGEPGRALDRRAAGRPPGAPRATSCSSATRAGASPTPPRCSSPSTARRCRACRWRRWSPARASW